MNTRKLLSLLLAAALCLGLAAPALAEDVGSDAELMAVTAKVKTTLALDTQEFDDFRGWCDEDALLGKRWNLEWSGDGVWMNIAADAKGKVYSYNRSESAADQPVEAESWYMGGKMNIPRLPEDKSEAALAAAQAFLDQVLESPVESVALEKSTATPSLRQVSYRFSGTVKLNGLPSPINCSLTVRGSDLAVTRFWRNDQSAGYLGAIPDPQAKTSEAQARRLLQSTVKLEAKFVLTQDDPKVAKVCYVPVYGDEYYVDGQSGELVNLTELRRNLRYGAYPAAANKFDAMEFAAEDAGGNTAASLTTAEKNGAAILAGALSKEELDQAIQNAWPEIGLGSYTLSAATYSVIEKDIGERTVRTSEDYDVTCRLTYGKKVGSVLKNKYITADAKTGTLQSLSSRRWFQGEGKDVYSFSTTFPAAQAKAENILKSFAGKHFADMALFDSSTAEVDKTWEHSFSFQQKAGQWFYDGNSYYVGVDATDGTISRLGGNFDESVELRLPQTTITVDEAVERYVGAMDLAYGYMEVPVSISLAGQDVMPLLKEAGYTYVTALKTGYALTQPKNSYLQGVDAESGQVLSNDYSVSEQPGVTYSDLEGHWVQTAAEALAHFGIGLRGGQLKPGDTLTQLDMVALLSSVDGYTYNPATATKEETDWLYNHAYALGLVTPETRNEQKAISRGELVKLILDAAGYRRIAGLTGIFKSTFSDSAAIPAADQGYAALAQGFGLVKGGSDGAYAAGREATRAEAVAMLYQYMK